MIRREVFKTKNIYRNFPAPGYRACPQTTVMSNQNHTTQSSSVRSAAGCRCPTAWWEWRGSDPRTGGCRSPISPPSQTWGSLTESWWQVRESHWHWSNYLICRRSILHFVMPVWFSWETWDNSILWCISFKSINRVTPYFILIRYIIGKQHSFVRVSAFVLKLWLLCFYILNAGIFLRTDYSYSHIKDLLSQAVPFPFNVIFEGLNLHNQYNEWTSMSLFCLYMHWYFTLGEGKHFGGRHGFQELDLDKTGPYMHYVGLRTPPRTLTMEEAMNFPMLEEKHEEERETNLSQNHSSRRFVPNGYVLIVLSSNWL